MGAFTRFVTGERGRTDLSGEPKLPQGAEAALWSILEAAPDPRNHLILARDLSGEVRITDYERTAVTTAFAAEPAPRDEVIDIREMVDPYYDLGVIAENTPLTENLFTTAE